MINKPGIDVKNIKDLSVEKLEMQFKNISVM